MNGCERGLREAPPTETVKAEGGGNKWGRSKWKDLVRSLHRVKFEKITLRAQWNLHPVADELLVKCKCIPQQPRNKQAATSLPYN